MRAIYPDHLIISQSQVSYLPSHYDKLPKAYYDNSYIKQFAQAQPTHITINKNGEPLYPTVTDKDIKTMIFDMRLLFIHKFRIATTQGERLKTKMIAKELKMASNIHVGVKLYAFEDLKEANDLRKEFQHQTVFVTMEPFVKYLKLEPLSYQIDYAEIYVDKHFPKTEAEVLAQIQEFSKRNIPAYVMSFYQEKFKHVPYYKPTNLMYWPETLKMFSPKYF